MSIRVKATAKYVRGSTRRAQLVVRAIKGKSVADATAILRFLPHSSARDVASVLKSATANAEANHSIPADRLAFKLIWQLPVLSAGAVTIIVVGASLLSMLKVIRLDPKEVFSG